MKKIESIHNKTKVIQSDELPYNNTNIMLKENDLRKFFDSNGLEGIQYNNINLYRTAFIHKSYCTMKNADFATGNTNCPKDCIPLQDMSYERLEFLGDAILNMVVANYLYFRFPDQNEGFLSKIRTRIVNGKMLGFLSNEIGFDKFAIISKQVEESNGRSNYKIMEDIFEAFIGALYTDFQNQDDQVKMPEKIGLIALTGAGYYIAEKWIITIIETYIDFSELILKKTNYKDMLVSYMQHSIQDTPKFCELGIITKDCVKIFNYCVKNRSNDTIATATGFSKKDAENNVSREALIYYGQLDIKD
uniref:RNase III domain-containing protein n=1 Tax=viral metagenome TaxID=1070528 RepID=A0A6C0CHL2_9ZZZZ